VSTRNLIIGIVVVFVGLFLYMTLATTFVFHHNNHPRVVR